MPSGLRHGLKRPPCLDGRQVEEEEHPGKRAPRPWLRLAEVLRYGELVCADGLVVQVGVDRGDDLEEVLRGTGAACRHWRQKQLKRLRRVLLRGALWRGHS